jgi:predicted unusual protein kinase regulating ubiquinone biosynthesis (AarF/ABC1/UbiB family)
VSDDVPQSRLRRLGKLAWMSRKAIPLAVSRFRGRGEPAEDIDEKNFASHLGAAKEVLATLGNLKGLALKVGQMLSYMDGALPPDAEPAFRKVLSKLQQDAPSLSWEQVSEVLSEDLGTIDEHFASIDHTPFAAASIGQVHKARLSDGTEVAVKVQYPGIREAMTSDLDNLGMVRSMILRPMMGAFGASSNVEFAGNVIDEVRDRLLEELDYRREAKMQTRFRELYDGDEGLVVPEVFVDHSGDRVLTTRYESGEALDDVADAPEELRNTWSESLARCATQQLYVHRLFNGDPHPGNYLFRRDGTVVLLDFGCIKEIDAGMNHDMERYVRATIAQRRAPGPATDHELDASIRDAFNLQGGEPEVFDLFKRMLLYVLEPIAEDRIFHFTREYTAGVNDLMIDGKRELVFGKGKIPHVPKVPPMPGGYTFLNRMQWGFYSVLTRLDAKINWYRMLPERIRV